MRGGWVALLAVLSIVRSSAFHLHLTRPVCARMLAACAANPKSVNGEAHAAIPREVFLGRALAAAAATLVGGRGAFAEDIRSLADIASSLVERDAVDITLKGCGVLAWCAPVSLGPVGQEGATFTPIIDTGSPFLMVPTGKGCGRGYGCVDGSALSDSGIPETEEVYGSGLGRMAWRTTRALTLSGIQLGNDVQVGVPDRKLLLASGGVFLGLIENQDDRAHPSLLQQLALPSGGRIAAFAIDGRTRRLTLSLKPLLPPRSCAETRACARARAPARPRPPAAPPAPPRADACRTRGSLDALPLADLRPLGVGVQHYAVRVDPRDLRVNGRRLPSPLSRPLYCVFDTGLSCGAVSRSLADDLGVPPAPGRCVPPAPGRSTLRFPLPKDFFPSLSQSAPRVPRLSQSRAARRSPRRPRARRG